MQNVVMADRTGRIAYKAVGMIATAGGQQRHPWGGACPGLGSALRLGRARLPYDETPQDEGSRGWIATANQRIHAPDYPHFVTQDWAPPYRQDRIAMHCWRKRPDTLLRLSRRFMAIRLSMATSACCLFCSEYPVFPPLVGGCTTGAGWI